MMRKRLLTLIISGCLLMNLYGCVALLAGAAGGAGTAAWLSGKLVQTVNAPYDKTVAAVKSALASMNLELTKETADKDVDQIRSLYTDGRKIWIDVHSINATSSKIEIRVGARGDKDASDLLFKKISSYLTP
jgi:hypothetical protein